MEEKQMDEEQEGDGEREAEEEKPSAAKRVIIIISVIFVLFIFLSYFAFGSFFFEIVESLAESHTLSNMVVKGNGYSIIFDKEAYDELANTYLENQKYEFKACLIGNFSGKDYFVHQVYLPKISQQSYANVISAVCPEGTIIDLHSHPYRMCIASAQDFETYGNYRKINPAALMMVMCEKGRFYVYGGDK